MKISIIIPTINEEQALPTALARLRETAGSDPVEIIVSDGGSKDQTVAFAHRDADLVVECPSHGRAKQMHQGALASTGDILLFLHADTRLPEGWSAVLRQVWGQPDRPAATAFLLRFDDDRPFYRFLAAAANWRTRCTGVPQGDQGIAVGREIYFSIGGFPPVTLMEEYYLFRKLRHAGNLILLPHAVLTSTRRYEKNGPLRNALRNTGLLALHYLGVGPETLARMYR